MNLPAAESEFTLSDDLISGLKAKYQQIDVQQELYLMNLWLHKNPARRPKLMLRFIEKWLSKCRIKPVKLHAIETTRMTEFQLLETGRKLGVQPRPGEGWGDFARRLQA